MKARSVLWPEMAMMRVTGMPFRKWLVQKLRRQVCELTSSILQETFFTEAIMHGIAPWSVVCSAFVEFLAESSKTCRRAWVSKKCFCEKKRFF